MAFTVGAPKFRAIDTDGTPLAGAKVYAFTDDGVTPLNTYTTLDLGTLNAYPVVLDSRGEADIVVGEEAVLEVRDTDGVTVLYTLENVALTNVGLFDYAGSTTSPGKAEIYSNYGTYSFYISAPASLAASYTNTLPEASGDLYFTDMANQLGVFVPLSLGGTNNGLYDPGADRLLAGASGGSSLVLGAAVTDGLAISGTNLTAATAAIGAGTIANVTISSSTIESGATFSLGSSTLVGGAYSALASDLTLSQGGTGASLTDPNADRIMFWDDSAGQVTWLTPSGGFSITGTNVTHSGSYTSPGTSGSILYNSAGSLAGNAIFTRTGTGALALDGTAAELRLGGNSSASGYLSLLEASANGTSVVKIQPAASLTADKTAVLPTPTGNSRPSLLSYTSASSTLELVDVGNSPVSNLTGIGVNALTSPSVLTADTSASNALKSVNLSDLMYNHVPLFFVYRGSVQSVASSTFTKVQYNTESVDLGSYYDNATNYRFTPGVAGYYQFGHQVTLASIADGVQVISYIYKNGGAVAAGTADCGATGGGSSDITSYSSDIVYLNGSTDYVEFYVLHNHGANRDVVSSIAAAYAFGYLLKIA